MEEAQRRVNELLPPFMARWTRRQAEKKRGEWIDRRCVSEEDKLYYEAVAALDRISTDRTYYCPIGGFVYTGERGDADDGVVVGARPPTPTAYWSVHADDEFALIIHPPDGTASSPRRRRTRAD